MTDGSHICNGYTQVLGQKAGFSPSSDHHLTMLASLQLVFNVCHMQLVFQTQKTLSFQKLKINVFKPPDTPNPVHTSTTYIYHMIEERPVIHQMNCSISGSYISTNLIPPMNSSICLIYGCSIALMNTKFICSIYLLFPPSVGK